MPRRRDDIVRAMLPLLQHELSPLRMVVTHLWWIYSFVLAVQGTEDNYRCTSSSARCFDFGWNSSGRHGK